MRVVVVKAGALGDALVAAPALVGLRRAWPQAHIVWCGHAGAGRLFIASGLVNDGVAFDDTRLLPLFMTAPTRWAALESPWSAADLGVVWLSRRGDGDLVATNLTGFGVKEVVRADPTPPSDDQPVWAWLQATLADLTPISATMAEPMTGRLLRTSPTATEWAVGWLGQQRLRPESYVVLHPGSGGAAKRWPVAGFHALGQAIGAARDPHGASDRLSVVVTGSDADQAQTDALAAALPEARALLAASLDRFAAVVALAGAYVGNDAGPTHLAALLGVPTLAIFGPSSPTLWRPWGAHVQVWRPGSRRVDATWDWTTDVAPAIAWLRGALAPSILR